MMEASRPTAPTLLLRPWTVADAVALREAIDEDLDHLKPWLNWTLSEPATLDQTRVRLQGYVDRFRSGEAFYYAVTPLDRPAVILGGAHLACRVGPAAHDVGYWVRKSAARQGIASAAVAALAVHAFSERLVERLVIQCDVANHASATMARALGFLFVDSATVAYVDGTPRPVHRFEMAGDAYHLHAPKLRERARRVRLVTDPAPDPVEDGTGD
jgi:RimJ/RimL family protein N-acetyltransferase